MNKLPPDIIMKIGLNLELSDLTNLCRLSSRFNKIICNNDIFWMNKFHKDIGYHKPTWKNFYTRIINSSPYELMFEGILTGNLFLVKQVITSNNDCINESLKINSKEYTPVEYASVKGRLDIIKYLVEQGANIHAGFYGALLLAGKNGHLEVVKYLVEQCGDDELDYALIKASKHGYLDIVKYLVEHGADIYILDNDPLMAASMNGHLEVVKYLVGQGGDIYSNNSCAWRLSKRNGHTAVVKYIESLNKN